MKRTIKFTSIIALIGLVSIYGIITAFSNPQISNSEYAILTYYPYSATPYIVERERFSLRVFYSDKNVENIKLTKEELAEKPFSSVVATTLARLNKEGYTLISTSAVSTIHGTGTTDTDTEIHCFLKK